MLYTAKQHPWANVYAANGRRIWNVLQVDTETKEVLANAMLADLFWYFFSFYAHSWRMRWHLLMRRYFLIEEGELVRMRWREPGIVVVDSTIPDMLKVA